MNVQYWSPRDEEWYDFELTPADDRFFRREDSHVKYVKGERWLFAKDCDGCWMRVKLAV